jgi:mRNA interferase RelE/StbE
MKYSVVIAYSAEAEFENFDARWQSALLRSIHEYLEHEPAKESKSRIKRLKGMKQPQYRLRVDNVRVFYDVDEERGRVEILDFVFKAHANEWLQKHGEFL